MLLVITIGQAYRTEMIRAVQDMGGEYLGGQLVDAGTQWKSLTRFPRKAKRQDVAQLMWRRFPGAAITVTPAGREDR